MWPLGLKVVWSDISKKFSAVSMADASFGSGMTSRDLENLSMGMIMVLLLCEG